MRVQWNSCLCRLIAREQAVAAKLRTSSRRTAELEVALKEHVEQESNLRSETAQLEEKLTQATETFREKLHKYAIRRTRSIDGVV